MGSMDLAPAQARASAAADAVQFERDGYVVARNMFSLDEMKEFIAECRSFEKKPSVRSEPNSKGEMRFYSELFRQSDLIRRFVPQQKLIDFIRPVTGGDLWVRWDQAVAKGPESGVFAWHTDGGYDRLPQPHFEIWIALTEMREDNGGLWVVPGSHKQPSKHRFIDGHMVADDTDRYDPPGSGKTFVHAEAGDVVLFSSRLLHKTYENTTDKARWAYVAETMKLSDFDPTIKPPYFVIARDGKAVCELVDDLPCAHDPVQIAKTLPLALRHNYAGPLLRKLKSAFKSPATTD